MKINERVNVERRFEWNKDDDIIEGCEGTTKPKPLQTWAPDDTA